MLKEVDSVIDFFSKLFRQHKLETSLVSEFAENLREVLYERYRNHWFPERPLKGSAYRCITNDDNYIDPLLTKALETLHQGRYDLVRLIPRKLTIWVDPDNVSFRIGDDGSIGVLFEARPQPILAYQDSCRISKVKSCKDQFIKSLKASKPRHVPESVAAIAS